MEYFKGFENLLDKDREKQIIKLFGDLLKEFGKLGFRHNRYSECFCHKKVGNSKLKIYLKDVDINNGFCLYLETPLNINIGYFTTVEELKDLIKNRTKIAVKRVIEENL